MPEIKNTQNINISNSDRVNLNGISNVVSNNEAKTNLDEIERAFESIFLAVTRLKEEGDKTEAKLAVDALVGEARKGEQAQEKNVNKWLAFLLDTAPDVYEVAIETFLNPIKGLSIVFQKIAKRMKDKLPSKKP